MRRIIDGSLVVAMAFTTGIPAAWAGCVPVGAPAPVIGLGIPALAGFALLYRRLRNRGEK